MGGGLNPEAASFAANVMPAGEIDLCGTSRQKHGKREFDLGVADASEEVRHCQPAAE